MTIPELFGYSAAILTTASFLPQAIKVLRTRDTAALSLTMFSVFTCGVFLWVIYGFMLEDKALIIANTITGILSLVILITKLKMDVLRRS